MQFRETAQAAELDARTESHFANRRMRRSAKGDLSMAKEELARG
jgi:hypothetical protein